MIKWILLAGLVYVLYRLVRAALRIRRVIHIIRDDSQARMRSQAPSYPAEKDITDRVRPLQ